MSELNIVPVPGYEQYYGATEDGNVTAYKGQLTDLGKIYGVTKYCIQNIKRGKSWKHI